MRTTHGICIETPLSWSVFGVIHREAHSWYDKPDNHRHEHPLTTHSVYAYANLTALQTTKAQHSKRDHNY
jgi:hypothetical protein